MPEESLTQQLGNAINEGRRDGGSFFGSILAGTLLGLGLDAWLDAAPIFVMVGIVLGVYAAFVRLWHEMKSQPEPVSLTRPPIEDPAE